jgi:hypothetical protein
LRNFSNVFKNLYVEINIIGDKESYTKFSKELTAYFRKNRSYPNMPITRHAIMYRIKNKMNLPEVIKYLRVGKVHVLTVAADF